MDWMIMDVVKSQTMTGFEYDPRDKTQGSPTDGRRRFQISCCVKQEITMRVTLGDAAGNLSNSMDFSFKSS